MSLLPSEAWKQDNSLKSHFNNQLLSGLNQGLNLYSPDQDLKLFKPLDTKPLDKLNFDELNEDLDKNRNIYENIKSGTSGLFSGVANAGTDSAGYLLKSLGFDPKNATTYLGLFLLILILFKKI